MALASPTARFKGDVHIPLCGKDRCEERLLQLSKAFHEKGLICVTDYGPSGRFIRGFEEAFENCTHTVIHRCKTLWKKIGECRRLMFENDTKVSTINVSGESRNRSREERESDFHHFFNIDFTTRETRDEKSVNSFVQSVASEVQAVKLRQGGVDLRMPDVIDQHLSQAVVRQDELREQSEDDMSDERLESFDQCPDFFGQNSHSRLYIRKEFLKYTQQRELKLLTPGDCAKAVMKVKEQSEEEFLSLVKYILHKGIPELYESQNVIGLTFFATCDQSDLQDKATMLLQLMLFSKQKRFDFSTQVIMETLVYQAILDQWDKCKNNEQEKSDEVVTHKLGCLYMMIVSEMILSSKEAPKSCDKQLETIGARSFPTSSGAFHDVDMFIKEVTKKSSAQRRKMISTILETNDPQNQGATLCKQNLATQVVAVFHMLKLMYKAVEDTVDRTVKAEHLCILKCFTNHKRDARQTNSSVTIALEGLVLFLLYRLKVAQNRDSEEVCIGTVCLVMEISELDLLQKSSNLLEMLFFEKDHRVRKEIIGKDKHYPHNQLLVLLKQVARLLSPSLSLDKSKIEDVLQKEKQTNAAEKGKSVEVKWSLVPGKFDGQDTLIRVHRPQTDIHISAGKSNLEDMYYKEMKVLERLQHKNIVKMLAFQSAWIPQFYILEDYQQNNLQVALKYKKDCGQDFTQTTLLKFLLDAAAGLSHCHAMEHVHCNLTSASLFIVGDMAVKLCGFQFCQKLVDGKGKGDMDDETMTTLSARWTAPESLQRREYTKASDVWMFGHLMFEVLTHGVLPYSHLEELEEAVTHIMEGKAVLPHEGCIKKQLYYLISHCSEFDARRRPTVHDICGQLKKFLNATLDSTQEQETIYPDNKNNKPSLEAEKEKGMPDVNTGQCIEDGEKLDEFPPVSISDTIIRLTRADEFIFREKIVQKMEKKVEIRLEQGCLQDILPKIRFYRNRGETSHLECMIPRSRQTSLLEMTQKKSLGESLKPYMEYIYQVALIFKKLHNKSWVLGDICASYLYVDEEKFKVYVVSLVYLKLWDPEEVSESQHTPPEDDVCARAAPEVVACGLFSPDSDVYCFGTLMWEVLTAFDISKDQLPMSEDKTESTEATTSANSDTSQNSTLTKREQMYKKKISEDWQTTHKRPTCCPEQLYDLIKACVHPNECRRIKMSDLVAKLVRICQEEFDCSLQDSQDGEKIDHDRQLN